MSPPVPSPARPGCDPLAPLDCSPLERPERLWTRAEILTHPCPVPRVGGVYGWFFREIPQGVPTTGCVAHEGHTLLYAGISPTAPPTNGKPPSAQTLFHRVRYHMRGNAEGSTLRLTLGCLLADELGIALRRVGSGRRMTFGADGEVALSEWLSANARVTWCEHDRPWELEARCIGSLSLPLNLAQNRAHPFHGALTSIRAEAKARARDLPILP